VDSFLSIYGLTLSLLKTVQAEQSKRSWESGSKPSPILHNLCQIEVPTDPNSVAKFIRSAALPLN